MKRKYRRTVFASAAVIGLVAACGHDPVSGQACLSVAAEIKSDEGFDELSKLVSIQTYRADNFANEDQVVANIQAIQDMLAADVQRFNEGQFTHKLETASWRQETNTANRPKYWWVFAIRVGHGARKVSVMTHFDTVSPGSSQSWQPFNLHRETRDGVQGGPQEFWVGRGAIDDKGPVMASLRVLKDIARTYDGSALLDQVTVELLFDTSEETWPSPTAYFQANAQEKPDLAVVMDAAWCVRGEKGIERPVFNVGLDPSTPHQGVWVDSLTTPLGPSNQIPDSAEAIIRADASSQANLQELANDVNALYAGDPFDDPNYQPAKLTVDTSQLPNQLRLVTAVAGAQHGSAPQENRAEGANPLVSLSNFLGNLVAEGKLADNEVGHMCKFIKWMWGTRVLGESHPDLLEAHDDVFGEGNGTTYAITRIATPSAAPGAVSLQLDVRYALGHQQGGWDGKTEGLASPGQPSKLSAAFKTLVDQFNQENGTSHAVTFTTFTALQPDLRLPDGPAFSTVSKAYMQVMGRPCPPIAVGFGTDAKANPPFLAAGALFSNHLGPPVNFHGIDEGAPVDELAKSAEIVCRVVDNELQRAKE